MSINTSKNWKVKPLCEVTDVIMGQSPASKYYNFEGEGLPFFQGKTEFGEFYPTARKWCSKPNKIAKDNDILISVRAPVGPTNIANQECCIGRGLAAIRPLDELPHKYILYFLRSVEQQIESLGTGTTFKAISGQTLRNLSVPIAPPEQQKQIVEEIEKQFSRLDKTIADLKRVKANLKRYKASVLQAAVTGKLTEQWRKQNPDVEPASKLLERILMERRQKWEATELAKMTAKGKPPKNDKWKQKYKEPTAPDTSDQATLPPTWSWVTTTQVASVRLGKMLDKSKHTTGKESPYLRNINVRWGHIETDNIFKMFFKDNETDKYSLDKADVLVCEGGEPGRAAVWNIENSEIKFQKALHRVRFFGYFQPELLVHYLEFLAKSGRLEKRFTGSTIKHFTGEAFSRLPIPFAPIKEQEAILEAIESKLSVSEKIERTVDANLKRAECLRQSILKQAFSGKLL